jgi:hypothetical protein
MSSHENHSRVRQRTVDGEIGKSGAFDYLQGGESYDSANAAFGTKGSC